MRKVACMFAFLLFVSVNGLCQKKGIELVDSLLTLLPAMPDDTAKLAVLKKIAGGYRNLFRKEEETYVHKQYELAKKLNYEPGIGDALMTKGHNYTKNNQFKQGLECLEEAARIFDRLGDREGVAMVLINLGSNYDRQAQPQKALEYYAKACDIDEKDGRLRSAAKTWINMGGIYLMRSENEKALSVFRRALAILDPVLDKVAVANVQMNMGSVYQAKGDYVAAYTNFLKALKTYEEVKSKTSIALAYKGIGTNFHEQKLYNKAIEYHEKQLKIYEELGALQEVGRAYNSLANCYEKIKDRVKWIACLNKSLELAKQTNDLRNEAATLNNMGLYHRQQGEYKTALNLYEQVEKTHIKLSNKSGMVSAKLNQGTVFREAPDSVFRISAKKRFDKALVFYQDAMALAKQIGEPRLEQTALAHLVVLHEKRGEYRDAYRTQGQYFGLKDSLMSFEKTRELTRKEMEYEFEKKEDSLRYAQQLVGEKLKQQTLLTEQEKLRAEQQTLLANEKTLLAQKQTLLAQRQQQELQLKEANLELLQKESTLQRLAFEKTEAELAAEQSQRQEKEKQLVIAEQQKTIQQTQLNLRTAELSAKDKEIASQKQKRNLYIAGFSLLLLSLFFMFRNYRNKQIAHQKLSAEKLKTQKAEATRRMAEFEMHGLRAQLNPHFMFNSLNAIQEQILKEDTENASTYLTTFARMLRQLLENAEFAFVPLQKEVEFLKRYLLMEQLRLPDLQYHFFVDPAIDTETTMIPNMILQPYLENAIWHGLSPKQGDKFIEVAIHHKTDGIIIQITDNGIGREKAAEMKSKYRKAHKSKGMELLQKRFELIKVEFGSQIQIDIEDLKEGNMETGTKVSMSIPHTFSEPMKMLYAEINNN